MNTYSAIIDSFGGPGDFSNAIGISGSHARVMRWRDSIPPTYWPAVVTAAASRGLAITYELLAGLAAQRGRSRTRVRAAA